MFEFKLPDLGENVADADVLRVLVREGQTVAQEDPVLEIESEKATLEVPAPVAGTITAVHVQPGDTIKVGQLLFTLDEAQQAGTPAEAGPVAATPPAPSAEPAKQLPPEAPTTTEPTLPAPVTADRESGAVATGSVAAPPPPTETPLAPVLNGGSNGAASGVAAAPSVRRFAREIGVDLGQVAGSGPGGRVLEDDVKRTARETPARPGPAIMAGLAAVALPDFSRFGTVETEPMSRVRRATAENLGQAWAAIPHVTIFESVDVTVIEEFRKQNRARVEAAGGKLTITAFLLKLVASALKEFPKLNASIDMVRKEVVYKRYYHLGIASDTERGLLVPVIRDVDKKSLTEIAVELTQLAEKARGGKLKPDEMQGGSFTISNLGGMGTGLFTPIVNAPEVAILGVGRSTMEPSIVDGRIEPRLKLPLSLSFDHRLVDGADGARFMARLSSAIQEPLSLVFN